MTRRRDTGDEMLRALPFFFSANFFMLFVVASLLVLPIHYFHPSGIFLPPLLDAILLIVALADYYAGPSPDAVRIERPLPFPLAVDRANEVHLEITNRTGGPVSLIVRDDVPRWCRTSRLPVRCVVRPGAGTRLAYSITPLERGNGEFGNVYFWVKGRLGLVWKRGESPAARTVKLYPGLSLIERQTIQIRRPSLYDPVRAMRKGGEGTEFESLREYVVGDDSRLVHWRTTARRGKPVVRQNSVERSQTVFLVLDAGRMMTARVLGKTKLDHALNAALLLAYSALGMGDNVGVMVVGQDVRVLLPPSKGRGQFGRILDATYSQPAKLEEPRFYQALSGVSSKLRRRSLIVIFTDLIDERASEGLVRYTLGLLPRHLPVVVVMSDTEVIRVADSIPETERDLYRQGVAAEMLDRRERLLAHLTSVGVMVTDTPPDKISASVLDRYLEIKTRNLL